MGVYITATSVGTTAMTSAGIAPSRWRDTTRVERQEAGWDIRLFEREVRMSMAWSRNCGYKVDVLAVTADADVLGDPVLLRQLRKMQKAWGKSVTVRWIVPAVVKQNAVRFTFEPYLEHENKMAAGAAWAVLDGQIAQA